jgi:hypothetical protein
MAAAPTMMDLVSLREDILLSFFRRCLDLRVAADARTAMEATWTVSESLAGTG